MKTIILSLSFIGISLITFSQNTPCAIVTKVDGIPVYVMSEPAEEYTVVGDVTSAGDQLGMAVLSSSSADALNIQELVQSLVNKAIRKKEKGKLGEFDAMITKNGDKGVLIKFK